jgi:XTP/dITP diphosphohydrolase
MDGKTDRRATFHAVLCMVDPALPAPVIFEGEVNGVLVDAERGSAGFGYDPLFVPDGYTQTFGELGAKVKDKISHRAMALNKFKKYLETK